MPEKLLCYEAISQLKKKKQNKTWRLRLHVEKSLVASNSSMRKVSPMLVKTANCQVLPSPKILQQEKWERPQESVFLTRSRSFLDQTLKNTNLVYSFFFPFSKENIV